MLDSSSLPRLPPLPTSGLAPSPWRFVFAVPRSNLAASAVGLVLALALILKLWWLGGLGALLLLAVVRGSTMPTQVAHETLHPALVSDGHALVLVDLEVSEDGWTVVAQRLPLTRRRGLGSAERALGYLVNDLYRPSFLPLLSVCEPHQQALARPERADPGYFALLQRCAQEPARGEHRTTNLSHAAFAALFAGDVQPQSAGQPEPIVEQERSSASQELARSADDSPEVPGDVREWCAGLPSRGTAPLGPIERWYLRHERARLRRYGLLWALHALMGLISLAGLSLIMAHLLRGPLALLSLMGLLLWAPWFHSAWLAWRRLRLAQRVSNDLAGDRGLRFAGDVSATISLQDPEYHKLTAAGLLLPDLGRAQEIVVGPESRLLLTACGVAPTRAIPLHVGAVATAPAALDASLPPGVSIPLPEGYLAKRRWLSPSERAELGKHVRRLRPVRPWLVLYALGGPLVYAWIGDELAGWVVAIHLLIFAGMILRSFRLWRTQVMLEKELALGWILTLEDAAGEHRSECLALSGSPWSAAGLPASWRTRRDL
jgi:hypothetical protein